jgi:very-short-patch-repair endonuclease
MEKKYYCDECKYEITFAEYKYSMKHFHKALCRPHQRTTSNSVKLYQELKKNGIKCELEYWDGHIHADIAVPVANLYIEIDGKHHITDPKQLSSDIMRDFLNARRGMYTVRIPNFIFKYNFDEIVNSLIKIINILAGKDLLTSMDDEFLEESILILDEIEQKETQKIKDKSSRYSDDWSKLEISNLIKYLKCGYSIKKISNKLQRPPIEIKMKMKSMGIKK